MNVTQSPGYDNAELAGARRAAMTSRFTALVLLLALLYAIDFLNLAWSETARTAPLILLLVALLDTALLSAAVCRLRASGWRLAGIVFLLFYGVKTFLVGIEAVYLSDVLTPALARSLFVNGLVVAGVFSPVAVWALGRWAARGDELVQKGTGPSPRSIAGWLGRLLLAGILYLILFIGGGLLVFTPLANALDPVEAAVYSAGFEAPVWLPLFLVARGMLWALLALPAIRHLGRRSWVNGLLLGLVFAVLMADSLLFPGEIAPAMRAAHVVELFVENLLYGLVLVRLLGEEVVGTANE